MTKPLKITLVLVAILAVAALVISRKPKPTAPATAAAKPALTVTVTHASQQSWPITIHADGNIAAWQEASIGTETGGLKLASVNVNVGDQVKRGQILAQFSDDTLQADIAQQRASQAEAAAALMEATTNAERAQALSGTGAMSAQQIAQYKTAALTAKARLDAANALLNRQQLNLQKARIIAPDDGVISARTATVGAVIQAGQPLFSLIRQNRLEWRAELTAEQLTRIRPGQTALIKLPDGATITGKVRIVAPSLDMQTRTGIVYVDLPASSAARAGMFVKGSFQLGSAAGLSLPASAITERDGYSYVYRLSPDAHALLTRIKAGQHSDNQVEILSGITGQDTVISDGVGFLNDGDLVKVAVNGSAK